MSNGLSQDTQAGKQKETKNKRTMKLYLIILAAILTAVFIIVCFFVADNYRARQLEIELTRDRICQEAAHTHWLLGSNPDPAIEKVIAVCKERKP
jgi:uncharacterized membrane protein affecting hemolysin expression